MSDKPENLALLVTTLEEEVEELKAKRDNLINQIMDAERRKEETEKVDKTEVQKWRNQEIVKFSQKESKLAADRVRMESWEDGLKNREEDLVKKEKQLVGLNETLTKIQKERVDIYNSRIEAKKLMEEAQEKMALVKDLDKREEIVAEQIRARVKAVEVLEKRWNDLQGEINERYKILEERERELEAREKAFTDKEAINV